ncbi:MAG: CehA/McbA family metallohydrolase, partial [Acidimicrobiales bacterium]
MIRGTGDPKDGVAEVQGATLPARAETTVETVVTLAATLDRSGSCAYLPFSVPVGTGWIEVDLEVGDRRAAVGIGLFDQRGVSYQEGGFRGSMGGERASLFLAEDRATESFVPGEIGEGTWWLMLPALRLGARCEVRATVRTGRGSGARPVTAKPAQGVVVGAPGWYRGDLHCHTPASSDAWSSGCALTPEEWASTCRSIGLDFVAVTDHNCVSQNLDLAACAGEDVLLVPGEEVTSWMYGHATVSGIEPGDWVDFRHVLLAEAVEDTSAHISALFKTAESMGAYVSVAHPASERAPWGFFADGDQDPACRAPALEVWNGPFRDDSERALSLWDSMLSRGWRVVANGGSDLHGTANPFGRAAGLPTTVVYAEQLSTRAIVDGLRSGRSFVTRCPDGAELYVSASGPGGQRVISGGELCAPAGSSAVLEARVRGAASMELSWIIDGTRRHGGRIGSDDETVTMSLAVPEGRGYVRAEVRGGGGHCPGVAGEGDMQVLSNPVFLV